MGKYYWQYLLSTSQIYVKFLNVCVLFDTCCMALVSEDLSMSCAALQTLVLLSDFLNHVKIRTCYQLHEADNASYLLHQHDP